VLLSPARRAGFPLVFEGSVRVAMRAPSEILYRVEPEAAYSPAAVSFAT
jgi:hypothetical protein